MEKTTLNRILTNDWYYYVYGLDWIYYRGRLMETEDWGVYPPLMITTA